MDCQPIAWSEAEYRAFFKRLNGFDAYDFQVRVARNLAARHNILLRAPTGAGKTLTVITPFFYEGWVSKPARLIYAVPLRTLAQSIYHTARTLAARLELDPERDVRLQTGEQPDDPFLALGRVIITTYDQVLSGLLSGPYGLSPRLHNINSAAVCGALVVFDEFHLMETRRAFLTGAASLHLFRELTQTVWMTATATEAPSNMLIQVLRCVDGSPRPEEVEQLPAVRTAERRLRFHAAPLTAAAVLRQCSGRTIVISNSVGRAQALFRELCESMPDVPATLLHSRFFKPHRAEKERILEEFFGKGRRGRALLVATQVIEAGIDISCDDLHTELCPMNALVQRAGRCARYENEAGTIHVYDLPDVERAWLPYGDVDLPDPSLAATHVVLSQFGDIPARLDPNQAAIWVQEVHAGTDAQALRFGWQARQLEILHLIERNSLVRDPARVTHLIREESLDDVRVIVAGESSLPDRPGQREAVTVSRWRLKEVFAGPTDTPTRASASLGVWRWEFGDHAAWVPAMSQDELRTAAIVCLSPKVARYTKEIGLEVGLPGSAQSPDREEPPRPGYAPLVREGWAMHSRAVAEKARWRAKQDGVPGWLADGFTRRYRLTELELQRAIDACGLLHDFGKLQAGWQAWATAWQCAKHPSYQPTQALAHTDADPSSPQDRALARHIGLRRPPHAAAGAYLACAIIPALLSDAPPERLGPLAGACLSAILAHHGGWLPSEADLGLQPLCAEWQDDIKRLMHPDLPSSAALARSVTDMYKEHDKREMLARVLQLVTHTDQMATWWPLVAYLTRTLRLADQRATADVGETSDE